MIEKQLHGEIFKLVTFRDMQKKEWKRADWVQHQLLTCSIKNMVASYSIISSWWYMQESQIVEAQIDFKPKYACVSESTFCIISKLNHILHEQHKNNFSIPHFKVFVVQVLSPLEVAGTQEYFSSYWSSCQLISNFKLIFQLKKDIQEWQITRSYLVLGLMSGNMSFGFRFDNENRRLFVIPISSSYNILLQFRIFVQMTQMTQFKMLVQYILTQQWSRKYF